MIYEASPWAVGLFVLFVLFVLCLSFYMGNKAKSSEGYFAAGGTIHWGVNGIAFAGDYLSAASFLGICGMIATRGYDGFLYSIGYLAGWVVALFVVAEPMKRLGKYTFTDALDSKFNSKSIQLWAAISTLIVSMCYLIPQMVGAGALVKPLLGLEHHWGVIMVGAIVIFIVATAGMASTTYVQFLKGALLIVFSTILVFMVLKHGLNTDPLTHGNKFEKYAVLPYAEGAKELATQGEGGKERHYKVIDVVKNQNGSFLKLSTTKELSIKGQEAPETREVATWWHLVDKGGQKQLEECLSKTVLVNGETLYNGAVKEAELFYSVGNLDKIVMDGKEVKKTGPLGPFKYLNTIENSNVVIYKKATFKAGEDAVSLWYPETVSGQKIMRPGMKFKVEGGFMDKLNFISLMLALFFGTSALPHILIRYYTVPSQAAARKSTIVAIAAIGFFYILTLFMGTGAMANGVIDIQSSNMSAPLLAKIFGLWLFAVISAIAFATVLGTVSGLIVAASGAVAHDLMDNYMGIQLTDKSKVRAGKIAAVFAGIFAIILGICFSGVNVSFLVGWAFAVAASANLPAILMLLFWKRTTAKGIATSVAVGMFSALAIILVSPSMCDRYFAWWQVKMTSPLGGLDNPGIISIPLSFITLIVVSLLTQKKNEDEARPA